MRRLGSPREIDLDVRVVASTNQNLKEAIAKGAFAKILYFRLNVFEIHLPPLRDRGSDVAGASRRIDRRPEPQARLPRHRCFRPKLPLCWPAYDWPGNVARIAQCARAAP